MIARLLSALSGADVVTHWTPQRAHQAEREMLRREGIVVEPSYLWSQPAQQHERQARINREQSGRRRFRTVTPMRVREQR